MNNYEQVKIKLSALEEQMQAKVPNLAGILADIRRTLNKDREVVTLLTDEEQRLIIEGLKKHTKAVLVTTKSKAKTKINLEEL